MAGFRESFGGNLDFAYQGSARRGRDLTNTLQSGVAGFSSIKGMISQAKQAQAALNRETQRLNDLMEIERRSIDKNTKAYAELTYRINQTRAGIEKMKKSMRSAALDTMEKSLGGLTKKLLTFNTTLLGLGFDFLIDSIKRVYELQERWAKAIGGFNMKLGGMSSGLQAATKAAAKWSSTMRGLTNGDIQEGIEMFGDFTLAVGRVSKALDFQKWGLQVARGFGLGGEGAGQLAKVLSNIGESADDTTKLFGGTLVSAAQAADVPITILAKDLQETSTYMARFGKEGTKTFVQGAAYARKFTISMKQLQGAVEGFDMFDDAAKTASKLNTAFGTMVNSMDLMMEDDPAKRLEMIRQQFLAQGKTFDTLKPKQVRYLSETLKLSEDQVAALLDVKNANVSYADFKAKEAAKEKQELDAKRNMELMLRKTTQTLFAFGQAFDKITLAIAKAIRPMLEVFGLAKSGGKDWNSFGTVMSNVTDTVAKFFESLADGSPGAEKWQAWIRTLAQDLVKAAKALKDFVMSGRAADMVGELADTMKSFYVWVRDLGVKALPYIDKLAHAFMFLAKNVKYVAAAWLGMKGIGSLLRPGGGPLGMISGMLGGGNKGLGAGRLAKGAIGVGGGVAIGQMLGGGSASIGGGIGGLLGSFMGPLGATLGPVVGAALGKAFDYFTRDSKMEDSATALADAQKEAAAASQRLSVFQERAALALKKSDMERTKGDRAIIQMQKGKQFYEIQDKQALIDRVKQLQGFGKHTELTAQALEHLKTDGVLSKDMLKALREAGAEYNSKLNDLSAQTAEFVKLQQEKMGFDVAEMKTQLLKNREAAADLEIADLKRQREKLGRGFEATDSLSDAGRAKLIKIRELDSKIRQKTLDKNEIGNKLAQEQKAILNKQLDIQMKSYELETLKSNTGFMKFVEDAKKSGLDKVGINKLAQMFLTSEAGQGAAADIKGVLDSMGGRGSFQRVALGMASGGVVMRPTRALIGEAGPEAVIPLRSLARGRMGAPIAQGGQATNAMMNYAGNRSQASGGTQVVSTVAEVKLDSQMVGRALVRSIITGR